MARWLEWDECTVHLFQPFGRHWLSVDVCQHGRAQDVHQPTARAYRGVELYAMNHSSRRVLSIRRVGRPKRFGASSNVSSRTFYHATSHLSCGLEPSQLRGIWNDCGFWVHKNYEDMHGPKQ